MCGRYALYGPVSRHSRWFGIDEADWPDFTERYNIAPTQVLPVIRTGRDGVRRVVTARWGLIPYWVEDPAKFQKPIIARAETAAAKPMFRQAYARSRVLVPASCFYEWRQGPAGKTPYWVGMADGGPFAMAGLLERWEGPSGPLLSYAILTTAPNALCRQLHDRMPAILLPEHYGRWLDPAVNDPGAVAELVTPYPAEGMRMYPVSARVNNTRNDDVELVAPAADGAP